MTDIKFKKWLDKLQENSWNLELIITGFSIYGLIMFSGFLDELRLEALYLNNGISNFGIVLMKIAVFLLIFNLCIHVLARGLWIGCLGLRSVSGEINYKELNYSQKFIDYLQKKVGSFDRYIFRLENFCSSLFAITFLLLFYLISLFIFLFILIQITDLVIDETKLSSKILLTIVLILVVGGIINLIDFFGLGILKKKKWTSKMYFPIYRFFSFITLSFLYRPLVYNLLDHKQGKRISAFLVPIYMIILVISGMTYRTSNFFSEGQKTSSYFLNFENYEDQLEGKKFAKDIIIPSKIINEPVLEVFYRYREGMEDTILKYNKTLDSLRYKIKDRRGYGFSVFKMTFNSDENVLKEYSKTFNHHYFIEIGGTLVPSKFLPTIKPNKQMGFQTVVSLKNIEEGEQVLRLYYRTLTGKEEKKLIATIPFWYYKNE